VVVPLPSSRFDYTKQDIQARARSPSSIYNDDFARFSGDKGHR